jgi:hypothetical protein
MIQSFSAHLVFVSHPSLLLVMNSWMEIFHHKNIAAEEKSLLREALSAPLARYTCMKRKKIIRICDEKHEQLSIVNENRFSSSVSSVGGDDYGRCF